MNKWIWWFIVNAGLLGLVLGQYFFNLSGLLLEADKTYLTFFIIGISLVTSFTMYFKQTDVHWFASDAVLSIGMVGTLFGFLMVLGQSFSAIDTSSTESMTAAISLLATGMSTALVTSLVGLIASLWLKLQLVVLDT
tara:strand:- start:122 stop:532 length:411 start_codon:yes stop_codon:yes gene_type:complete